MKKSGKTAVVIIIAVAVIIAVPILMFIHGVFWFLGYETPVERYYYKLKTDAALEKKYPGHDFEVREEHGWGEYGYSVGIYGMDENGIEFWVQWVDDEMQDKYHEEWNKYYYGEKLVEYQNSLRDKYFPQISYVDTYEYSRDDSFYYSRGSFKEVFYESMDDAIEGSKENGFYTDVTYKGIDIYTADDEELAKFADSMADSLIWLSDETGYRDIRVGDFFCRTDEEDGTETKDELEESIIKEIMTKRKIEEDRKK